jgi:hypothetical protein
MHGEIVFVGGRRVKIVSRPEETLAIQFREFERPKKSGRMQLKESKTITASRRVAQRDPRQIARRSERGGGAMIFKSLS